MKAMAHQTVSLKFMRKRKHVADFSDPGTGKTYVEIMDFIAQFKMDKKAMLVVCPKSLMVAAWANDIKKFAPTLRVSIATAKNRDEAMKADADVYIVNVDGVKALLKYKPAFWKKFGRCVIDESTAFKHYTSARSKAMAKIMRNFEWRRVMTGTPTSNGICDMWHQIFLLDNGKRLGSSFYGFRSACCVREESGPEGKTITWIDKENIELVVSALLTDIVIRYKFEDCVDIPENHMYSIPCQLSSRNRKAYEEMKAKSIAMLQTGKVSAINKGVLRTKLLQIASGAVYNDEGGYSVVGDLDRYELALDMVEARKHTIVFYTWKHQLEELVKMAKARKITHEVWNPDRPEIEKHFQSGFYQVLFAHPMSAAHGLTLTKGTATIWVSPTSNLEHFQQGRKRVHRLGQTEKTETIIIVAENTQDEREYLALQGKKIRMDNFLEELTCSSA